MCKENLPATVSREDIVLFLMPATKHCTDAQRATALKIAQSNNLNPAKREVHFVERASKDRNGRVVGYALTVITSYMVYLKRAERSGRLTGWTKKTEGNPKSDDFRCTITIHRKDWDVPFEHTLYWTEYQKGYLAKEMPRFMLEKAAIAQAFRQAFPEDLGGMPYSEEGVIEATLIDPESPAPAIADTTDLDKEFDSIPEHEASAEDYDVDGQPAVLPPIDANADEPMTKVESEAPPEEKAFDPAIAEARLVQHIEEVADLEGVTFPIQQRRWFKYAAKVQNVANIGTYADLTPESYKALEGLYHNTLKKKGIA